MSLAVVVNTGSTSVRLSVWHKRRPLSEVNLPLADATFDRLPDVRPDFVVHRVVHGGPRLCRTMVVDAAVEAELERVANLAPLHNPQALRWLRAAQQKWPVPQVAVFDTAFFADLPPEARAYALPQRLVEKYEIRRYGFHGIAHAAMWRAFCSLRPDLPRGGKVITLQLGGGCSAAAIAHGRPVETSMGFSPLEGLVMATRAGDVDAGLLGYLMEQESLSPADLVRLLDEQSGLLGMAKSADLRRIPADHPAVAVYCHRIRKYVGAYLAVLGGADGLVFGGGVGEHRADIRARVTAGLSFAGRLDVRVVAVDEAAVMVEEAEAVVQSLQA